MSRRVQSPRERAARALCAVKGLPENTRFEGGAMWESFLPEADAVLQAALPPEDWQRIREIPLKPTSP